MFSIAKENNSLIFLEDVLLCRRCVQARKRVTAEVHSCLLPAAFFSLSLFELCEKGNEEFFRHVPFKIKRFN